MSDNLDNKIDELKNNSVFSSFYTQNETNTKPKDNQDIKSITDDIKKDTQAKLDKATKGNKNMQDAILKSVDVLVNGDKSYKYKNKSNASNNYAITFKIDADLEQYLKNIEIITFIDTMQTGTIKSTTKNEYVNDLIRADLKKRLNIPQDETNPNKWIDAYKDYCKKYGITDNVKLKS